MATYISLIQWTQKGVEQVKESPARLDQAKEVFKAHGAELKEFYMAMGKHDMVIVSEGPDDMTVAKLVLTIASAGAIRTETMRVFPEIEYREIIASLP